MGCRKPWSGKRISVTSFLFLNSKTYDNMKQTKTILLTAVIMVCLFSAVLFTACTQSSNNNATPTPDPCASVTCYNGGTCSNGACVCPSGWTGTYCQTAVAKVPLTGLIEFVNNSKNPYAVYISGILQTTLSGNTHISYTANIGTYSCQVIQQSGYLVTPTNETFTANVTYGGTVVVTFP
jgi:hypothetical protein